MSDTWVLFCTGAAGAAIIKLLDGVVQFALQRRAKRSDDAGLRRTALEQRLEDIAGCMMISMLDRIQYLCKEYIRAGSVDVDDLRRLHIMHQRYHAVGGNGDLDALMKQVDRLPLTS